MGVYPLLELEPHVISIHGRTLSHHYKGDANWDAIAAAAEIVRKTDTLIFGNGDIHSLYEAAQRIRTTGVHGVLIGRASFGNPWIFRDRDRLKDLLNAEIDPTPEDLPEVVPSREERLFMALEHARVHAKLKGEDHFVELRKHMGWYLGHFHGAKQIRNALVRINSLADVEQIIQKAIDTLPLLGEEEAETPGEELRGSELDLSCAC
jgi:tRNA-dihydrouridine synthase B